MKARTLLIALTFTFAFGVLVGCVLFALFQSYVFIVALLGLFSLLCKLPPVIAKALAQSKEN